MVYKNRTSSEEPALDSQPYFCLFY